MPTKSAAKQYLFHIKSLQFHGKLNFRFAVQVPRQADAHRHPCSRAVPDFGDRARIHDRWLFRPVRQKCQGIMTGRADKSSRLCVEHFWPRTESRLGRATIKQPAMSRFYRTGPGQALAAGTEFGRSANHRTAESNRACASAGRLSRSQRARRGCSTFRLDGLEVQIWPAAPAAEIPTTGGQCIGSRTVWRKRRVPPSTPRNAPSIGKENEEFVAPVVAS